MILLGLQYASLCLTTYMFFLSGVHEIARATSCPTKKSEIAWLLNLPLHCPCNSPESHFCLYSCIFSEFSGWLLWTPWLFNSIHNWTKV
jgi:hypothetical protein